MRTLENQIFLPEPRPSTEELLVRLLPQGGKEKLVFGYLGESEGLEKLIADDAKKIAELGLTHEHFAAAIEKLFASDDTSINGNQIVRREYIHSPLCPWGDFATTSPFDYTMKDTELFVLNSEKCPEDVSNFLQKNRLVLSEYPILVEHDWAMIFSDLHPHLIRGHKFFEGKATPYRVDPERAVRYLGIK